VQAAEQSLVNAATVPTQNDSLDSGDATIGAGCAIGCPGQRPDLTDYLSMHYVPAQNCHCWGAAGETLEDSNADFSVAQLALAVGDTATYQKFLQRGEYWQNVFNPAFTSGTFTGYAWNRNNDGTWATGFSPTSSRGFAEGSTTQYSWMVYDDVAKLTELMGGTAATISRLDAFFDAFFNSTGSSSLRFDPTNEPDIQTPWMYDYLGVPSKTQSAVRQVVNLRWTNTTGGITGNDDLGTMSAWNVWASLGMWPYAPGRADLVLGSPLFPHIVVHRGNGTTITIDAPGASGNTYYVQGLSVNGAGSSKPWLPASFVSDGGTLQYTLSDTPSNWGSDPADAPPSLSTPPSLSVTHMLASQGASGPASVTVGAVDTMSGLDGAPACTDNGASLRLVAGPQDGTWRATVTSSGTHQVRCTATNYFGTTATATDTINITH
jgi:putative alpha-1,2-mannosidase